MELLSDGGHAVPIGSGETMSRRPRRNHAPAFKAKVASAATSCAAVRGLRSVSVYRIGPGEIWRRA